MIVKARIVLTMDGPPIENGAVIVDDNAIVAVGRADALEHHSNRSEIDLGEMVLLPGLINAHCHLDYTGLRHAISPTRSFTKWVQRINSIKRMLTTEDYLAAIARGFAELLKWGTTTVCNVESFPELMPLIPHPPMRTWWFYEMIDIRHRVTPEEVVIGALSFFTKHSDSLNQFGLSPHAPYTASQMLYRLANDCADTYRMRLTTHVAESREEMEMFRDSRGELYDFMHRLDRPMEDCAGSTPFAQLWESGSIDENWLLVHMNELSEGDLDLLSALPPERKPHVVHCPGSHTYFEHSAFPFKGLRNAGVNVCLGTDSLASTHSLSMFDEMRAFQEKEPQVSAAELLQMVTTRPARALKREGKLGMITPGALADLIALPFAGSVESVHEQIVQFNKPVPWMMIDGKVRAS